MSTQQSELTEFEPRAKTTLDNVIQSIKDDNLRDNPEKLVDTYDKTYPNVENKRRLPIGVTFPNERLAYIWEMLAPVTFTDCGFPSQTENQLRHPWAYAKADIHIDTTLDTPVAARLQTHEKLGSFLNHVTMLDRDVDAAIVAVRLGTGSTTYDEEDLKDDLKLLDQLEYEGLPSEEHCVECGKERGDLFTPR